MDVRPRGLSTSVFHHFDTLNTILERHEATIRKRWRKKTQDQRRKILLTAWGRKMSPTHRPDFDAFRREPAAQRENGTQHLEAFMFPYINFEDLLKPKMLLLMLNSRGRHGPATFAAADFEAMHLGLVTRAIQPIFLNEHVMLLRGGTCPETYGRLLPWSDHPDAFEWMSSRKEHQPGEGLLILEVQDRVLSFLVQCARGILSDMSDGQLEHGPTQPEPSLLADHDTGFASLTVMATEAPYRVPSELDITRMLSLLAAKRDETADHLWSLREDPGYYSFYMRESAEHRLERIKDTEGNAHPLFRTSREEILWNRVLNEEITSPYLKYEMWAGLHEQCFHLRDLQNKYSRRIRAEDQLPEEYLNAMLRFRHWLNQAAKGPMQILRTTVLGSPWWRPLCEREAVSSPVDTKLSVRTKRNIKLGKDQQALLWLLSILWTDGKDLFFLGITNALDELQRLIESSQECGTMLTSFNSNTIADLSIICECLRQIGLYQPWANTFDYEWVEKEKDIMADFARHTKSWGLVLKAFENDTVNTLVEYGNPAEVEFHYPIGKRKTKENVAAMQLAETNLDRLWTRVDEIMRRKVGNLQTSAIRALFAEPRILRRTSDWVEPSREEAATGIVNIPDLIKPLSELYFDLEHRTERTTIQQTSSKRVQTKPKTRGQATSFDATPVQPSTEQPDPINPQPTFNLDARALKVFRTLFFTPSLTATPGEISWTDFLHAMTSTGFRAEKLYGSVWQFTPTKLDVERGIQIHEPHPAGKIPYFIARRHGRRLNRAYGWHGEMFRLAEKEKGAK